MNSNDINYTNMLDMAKKAADAGNNKLAEAWLRAAESYKGKSESGRFIDPRPHPRVRIRHIVGVLVVPNDHGSCDFEAHGLQIEARDPDQITDKDLSLATIDYLIDQMLERRRQVCLELDK